MKMNTFQQFQTLQFYFLVYMQTHQFVKLNFKLLHQFLYRLFRARVCIPEMRMRFYNKNIIFIASRYPTHCRRFSVLFPLCEYRSPWTATFFSATVHANHGGNRKRRISFLRNSAGRKRSVAIVNDPLVVEMVRNAECYSARFINVNSRNMSECHL